MTDSRQSVRAGTLVEIHRYAVKSMMGESLNAIDVTEHGLLGDRASAFIDAETGKVASAKNPRLWPNLYGFRATYVEPPRASGALPPIRIHLPSGESVNTDQEDVESRVSAELGRPVRLAQSAVEGASAEEYRPDHEWLVERNTVVEFSLPPGTFFDGATVHLLTTATIDFLRALSPASRFEVARFRPNFVVASPDGAQGFVENDWIGRTLALGDVKLQIDGPCPRCVMTTLSQGSLPQDPAVLRTAVQNNEGNVGCYATVVRGGRVCCGDAVEVC